MRFIEVTALVVALTFWPVVWNGLSEPEAKEPAGKRDISSRIGAPSMGVAGSWGGQAQSGQQTKKKKPVSITDLSVTKPMDRATPKLLQ